MKLEDFEKAENVAWDLKRIQTRIGELKEATIDLKEVDYNPDVWISSYHLPRIELTKEEYIKISKYLIKLLREREKELATQLSEI